MKRTLYFMMALALVLGFTQCKKEQVNTPENETKTVNITLNVGGNGGGSRHDINTTTGAVDFQDGDVIYVGDGSTYIGTLTRTDGVFSGPINEPADETEIYFFFVGGLTPSATPEKGTTPSFTVDISDQSTKMPVLSCNHVTYYSNTTSYSCMLENQCALVKFTTASTTAPVHVGGLYTEAMIDFASNSITNNGTKGFVALNSTSETEKWAVLLPQTGFGAEAAVAHVGYTTTIPAIEADAFITGENAVSISTQSNIVYLDWLTSYYTATTGQTLKGKLGANVKISIADDATVTLDGVNITNLGDNCNWAGINCPGNATIILKDGSTNTVCAGRDGNGYTNYPGIWIAPDKTLTIKGGGQLTAYSNDINPYGAGIGGGGEISCGNIEIQGGDITATGGEMAAGIGSGCFNANCGTITITGGTVTATGGEGAGGEGAAGIGSGFYEASCGAITITGGTVMANGGVNAAGIGSGYYASCGAITISGGTVTATGVERGAGIGSGNDNASCGNITISGGTVTADGGVNAAGIGSGNESASCGTINITGGTVTATGGERAAGIGSGNNGARCGTITITTGVTQVTATKGKDAPDSIGKGKDSSTCGTVTIGCTLDGDGNPLGGTVYPDGISDSPYTYPPAGPVTYTELVGGEVLHVGDMLNVPAGQSWWINGGYVFQSRWSPYTVLRANIIIIDDEYEYGEVEEDENGAYYVIKDNGGDYYFSDDKLLPVTDTSDGIYVTYDGVDNNYTFSVHEP